MDRREDGTTDGRVHRGSHCRPTEPTDILIRTPNWLGDLLVSTSFVRAVLHRFPRARVDLIVRSGFETLPLPQRGRVLPYDRQRVGPGAFGRSLRGAGYTLLFVLPPSFSSAWMALCTGIPRRIGYRGEGRAWLLRSAVAPAHPPRSVHLAREYLHLLRPWMDATPEQYPAGLQLDDGWVAAHRPPGAPPPGEYVVLAPGAEYGPAKQWPTESYRAVARAAAAEGVPLVVAGLAKDRALGEAILAGIADAGPTGDRSTRAANLCGDTDLPGLTALLAGARVLISNDSGAMHLGAALGIPQIALFGSTSPTWTGPLNPRAEVFYRAEPCSPCFARQCPLGHFRCMLELRPEPVIERLRALLSTV